MRAHVHRDLICRDALAGHFVDGRTRQPARHILERLARFVTERLLDRLLAHAADIGEAHAVGRQQRRQRVDQHALHAERVGHQAGVLAAGAAEAIERIARHVVAALHGNFLDRVRHVLDRDLDKTVGDLLAAAAVADLLCHRCEGGAHGVGVKWLVLRRAEDFGKEIRDKLADHHIGVGHGERAAAAIAFWAGIGAGGIRADAKPRTVEMQDRAAASRYGMNKHHRRAHAHTGDFGLERAFVLASKMRHVGRGTAHVEADEPGETRSPAGLRHADDAGRRTRQDRILAAEQFGRGEPAR